MALYVISVGGSLIVPNEIDTGFLKEFKQFIEKRINLGDRFIIVTGGGKTCRKYQQAALEVGNVDDEENDWLGIRVTRLNAHLVKSILKDNANPNLIKDPENDLIDFKEPILIGAGWKPGWSTDFDSVILAKRFNSKNIINLSDVDYVYDSDPDKNPNAKPIKHMSWKDFKKLVGDKWKPGLSAPFDPIASKEAEASNLKVAILNGKNLDNLENYLDNKEFIGTLIEN
ncbi:MAG: UMP kinase [archaeon]